MHTQHPRVFSLHFVREVAGGWASGLSLLLLPLSAICSQASGPGGRPLQSKAPCFLSLLCAGDGPLLFRALPLDVGTDASHGHWLLDSAGCILAVVQGQGPRCATSAEAAALAGEPGLDRLGPDGTTTSVQRSLCCWREEEVCQLSNGCTTRVVGALIQLEQKVQRTWEV